MITFWILIFALTISLAPIFYRYSFLVINNVFGIKEEWNGQIEKPRLLICFMVIPFQFVLLTSYLSNVENHIRDIVLMLILMFFLLAMWPEKNILALVDMVTQTKNSSGEVTKVEFILDDLENQTNEQIGISIIDESQFNWEPKIQEETKIEHIFKNLSSQENKVCYGSLKTFMKMMKGEDLDENDNKIHYLYKGLAKNSPNGYNSQALVALIFTLNKHQDILTYPAKYNKRQVTREIQTFVNKYFYAEKSDILIIHDNIFDSNIIYRVKNYVKIFDKMIPK